MLFDRLFQTPSSQSAFNKFESSYKSKGFPGVNGSAVQPLYELPANNSDLEKCLQLLQKNPLQRSGLDFGTGNLFYQYLNCEFAILCRCTDYQLQRIDLEDPKQWEIHVDRFIWILGQAEPYNRLGDGFFAALAQDEQTLKRRAGLGFEYRVSVENIRFLRMKLMPFIGVLTLKSVKDDHGMYQAMLDFLVQSETNKLPQNMPQGRYHKLTLEDRKLLTEGEQHQVNHQNNVFWNEIPVHVKIRMGIEQMEIADIHNVSWTPKETMDKLQQLIEHSPRYEPS